MSKELEALHRIANAKNHFKYDTLELMEKDFQIVQQALQRLETIVNAKPSEALGLIKRTCELYVDSLKQRDLIGYDIIEKQINEALDTIKQALLKSQEQEKVLEIIFKKTVGIFQLSCCKNVYEYNDLKFNDYEKLTQEEFELLKRWVECQKD